MGWGKLNRPFPRLRVSCHRNDRNEERESKKKSNEGFEFVKEKGDEKWENILWKMKNTKLQSMQTEGKRKEKCEKLEKTKVE